VSIFLRQTLWRRRKVGVTTKRRIEITTETSEVVVIRRPPEPVSEWCELCRERVGMVRPEQAAILAGISWREVSRRVEAGTVHFNETPDGLLLICLKSLLPL